MSDIIDNEFDEARAMKFNEKNAVRLGWYNHIPEAAVAENAALGLDARFGTAAERAAFAHAVQALQQMLGLTADGALGGKTREEMHDHYNPIPDEARHYLHHEMRFAPCFDDDVLRASAAYAKDAANMEKRAAVLQARRLASLTQDYSSRVITYDMPGGYDLHKSGWRDRDDRDIRFCVIHWSSTMDEAGCAWKLRNDRNSSHFGVGRDVIYQWLDTGFEAYHAGYANRYSLGVDLCCTPKASSRNIRKYGEMGYDVEVMKNASGRGPDEVLTPDPRILTATRELILDISDIWDIPLRVPRGDDGLSEDGDYFNGVLPKSLVKSGGFRGFIGHHHINKKKFDIAPWWEMLFTSLFA